LREKGLSIDYLLVKRLLTRWKQTGLFKFTWKEMHAFMWSLCKPFGFIDTYSFNPRKWESKLKDKDQVVGNLQDLLQFLKEEWFLQYDNSIASVKDALDKYEGWVNVNGHFINCDLLPSIKVQKQRLFGEFQRLNFLSYPNIKVDVSMPYQAMNTPRMYSARMWDGLQNFTPSRGALVPGIITVSLYDDNDPNILIASEDFEFKHKPDVPIMRIIHFLFNNLPSVTPITSPVSEPEFRVINRSVRNISLRFLKKFNKWRKNIVT
jgi:hypothetical protein